MARVEFYEKPGCINNTKQKKLLVEAGHEVIAHNLLATAWSSELLLPFFNGMAVREWFNQSAPQITRGGLDPDSFDQQAALTAMCAEPLLIRRPLMRVESECRAGFNFEVVDSWIGLTSIASETVDECPRKGTSSCQSDPVE